MTDLRADISTIAGGRHDGIVTVTSTVLRPANSHSGIIAPVVSDQVAIRDGVFEITGLDPGPAQVEVQLGAWRDSWLVVIPDSAEPVDLIDLIQQFEELSPPLVSQAWQAAAASARSRDESLEAAAISVGMAELADRRAGDAAQSEALADQHRAAAESVGDSVVTAREVVLGAREDAVAARGGAEAAEAEAKVARDAAQAAAAEAVTAVDGRTAWNGAVGLSAAQVNGPAYYKRTLAGNATVTLPAGTAGKVYTVTLDIKQDTAGGRTLTVAGVKWPEVAPVVRPSAGAHDVIHVMWNGEEWLGLVGGQGFAYVAGGGA